MNKIKLIIQTQYITRVRKKSFQLTTFIVTLFFIEMYIGVIFLTKNSFEVSHAFVYIVDDTQEVIHKLNSSKNVTYLKEAQDLQQQIAKLGEKKHTSILYIPRDFYESMKVEYLSQDKPNINVQSEIKDTLNKIITDKKYEQLGISPDIRNSIKSKVIMNAKEIRADGKAEDSNTEVAMVIAMALSILVYITLFLYGAQVMRGIIEEKSNRIVEVIISSVK